MDIATKATRLKEYIRDGVPERSKSGANLYGDYSIQAHTKDSRFCFEVANVKSLEDDHISFSFFVEATDKHGREPIGEGRLASEGDGFKIKGLAITQPLDKLLSPQETGAMLLSRLDELAGLDMEQATLKLTGRMSDRH